MILNREYTQARGEQMEKNSKTRPYEILLKFNY